MPADATPMQSPRYGDTGAPANTIPVMPRRQYEAKVSKMLDTDPEFKNASEEQKAAIVATAMRRFDSERQSRVDNLVQQQRDMERRAVSKGPLRGAAAQILTSGRAAALNYADSATLFGTGTAAIGEASPETGGRLEESLQASQEGSPISSTVGQIAGFFQTPRVGKLPSLPTPSSMAVEAGGKALGKLTKGARGAIGLDVAETMLKGQRRRFLAQYLQNATTGAGATLGYEIARDREGPASAYDRFRDAWTQLDPRNTSGQIEAGVNAGVSIFTSRLGRGIPRRIRRAVADYERRTGRKLDIATLTDDPALQTLADSLSQSPAGLRLMHDLRVAQHEGFMENLDGIARENGLAPQKQSNTGKASSTVRRIAGDSTSEGALVEYRRGFQSVLSGQGEIDRIPQDAADTLAANLLGIGAEIQKGDGLRVVSKHTQNELKRLYGLSNTKGKKGASNMTVSQLEDIRQELARLAGFERKMNKGGLHNKELRALRRAYWSVSEAIKSSGPQYERALVEAEHLHRLEDALRSEAVSGVVDDKLVASFFSSPGVVRGWKAIRKLGTPDEIAGMRGWYLGELINRAGNMTETGTINPKTLRKLFNESGGMFNRQIVDEILGPDIVTALLDHAELSASFSRGVGKATGSDTARRQLLNAAVATATVATVGMAYALMDNEYSGVTAALGTAGTAAFITMILRSTMNGAISTHLQDIARGGGPRGMTSLPASLSTVFDESGNFSLPSGQRRGDRFGSEISSR